MIPFLSLSFSEVQVVIVERGGSATLPCMYHGDGNIFAVKWSKSHSVMVEYRGEPLKPYISAYNTNVPNGKDKNDFSIIISPADTHHEGIFTCRIYLKGKIDVVRTIKLEVPGKQSGVNIQIVDKQTFFILILIYRCYKLYFSQYPIHRTNQEK